MFLDMIIAHSVHQSLPWTYT